MHMFESSLLLLSVAALLLQVSRRLGAPYPAMLALAGACVAAIPGVPNFAIEPHLALALFITPALFDAAFDTAPRELKRNWVPLLALVLVAVVLTTAAVAWAGYAMAGLPLAAAVALGAIVAPPDAAAASAVLSQFRLPRLTMTILQGESLLNDAVALLLFSGAVSLATSGHGSSASSWLMLALAVPGGVLLGWFAGRLYLKLAPRVAGTLSSSIVEFVSTFGVWVIAERLHVSPILAIVVFAMILGHYWPSQQGPRDRIHAYAVWEATIFVLNVAAFLIMGMQARVILSRLAPSEMWHALAFAGTVLVIVILVRLLWVMSYGAMIRSFQPPSVPVPSKSAGLLVSWCGMRGLVTLATAFSLPEDFPGRDLIVLSAFTVVLGTLVLQGLTLGPLIKKLRIPADNSFEAEVSRARTALIDGALQSLMAEKGAAADAVRSYYQAARDRASNETKPQAATEHDVLKMRAIKAQRKLLAQLRLEGRIDDDVFHALEEELDWAQLDAAPVGKYEILSI